MWTHQSHASAAIDIWDYTKSEKTNWKEFPERAKPMKSTNLEDRLEILPTWDRGERRFIVYPSIWIIAPLLDISDWDADFVERNKKFDHYKYLENGVLQYVGPDFGEIGTAIIAGHSSFRDDVYNPYYTVFQAVPLSDVWDEVRVYERSDEQITRYIYEIQESYQADPSQRSLVEDQKEYSSITTYSCFPIWSNEKRRVNHAKLVSTQIVRNQKIELEPVLPSETQAPVIQKYHHSSADTDEKPVIYTWATTVVSDEEQTASDDMIWSSVTKLSIKERIKLRNKKTETQYHDSSEDNIAWQETVSILDRDTITMSELLHIYIWAKRNIYKKQLLIKIIRQIKQQKKKLIWAPSFDA